ncbi:hypothetical protein AB1N83_005735 [Pleurotus pulmonarius]
MAPAICIFCPSHLGAHARLMAGNATRIGTTIALSSRLRINHSSSAMTLGRFFGNGLKILPRISLQKLPCDLCLLEALSRVNPLTASEHGSVWSIEISGKHHNGPNYTLIDRRWNPWYDMREVSDGDI